MMITYTKADLQASVCDIQGNACALSVNPEKFTNFCLTPCEGVFADISKEPIEHFHGQSMSTILEAYESYKNFFKASPTYPVGISGTPI